eukprot:CAMPEP_0201475460 /NCGR_PEP_ID=MMETSP0151_2-20130828/887_1 /ASSEMBLY_ACC=CAM_ASM_000257 /TAXON_ID=200890 /ORGANISM="Paramoeba atlantica, Strain 621/1 / CCAP 1560/9" /LENGTH=663 /DNA_ID=CAMNT_0047855561 /DNA_START=113 /DNA_END=2102 /DNA_ORIENTATION=+
MPPSSTTSSSSRGAPPLSSSKDTQVPLRRKIFKAVRMSNGIQALLSLLRVRAPATSADVIRTLACRVLLGLANDSTVTQILGHLHLSRMLPDLVREPVQPGNLQQHNSFRMYAIQLMSKITGRGQADVEMETIDPALRKIEKNAIIEATEMTYSNSELLNLMYDHLISCGLLQAAQSLKEEARLKRKEEKQTVQNDVTLDHIVKRFLKNQHRLCPEPIEVVPPFSLMKRHQCPVPRHKEDAPMNITSRLRRRQLGRSHGGGGGRERDRQFIYGRFCPVRSIREEYQQFTCLEFLDDDNLLIGTGTDELKVFPVNPVSSNRRLQQEVLPSKTFELDFVPWGIKTGPKNTPAKDLLFLSSDEGGHIYKYPTMTAPYHSMSGVWMSHFHPLGTSLLCTSTSKNFIVDLTTKKTTMVFTDPYKQRDPEYFTEIKSVSGPSAVFDPSGDLILHGTTLWDARQAKVIHHFDRFTKLGSSQFHPTTLEVIINSQVWDLRTFKLLRTCAALEQSKLTFNSMGDVAFSILRNLPNSSSRQPLETPFTKCFRTVDLTNYQLICSNDLERYIQDLKVDSQDVHMAVLERGNTTIGACEEICRIYEIGKQKHADFDAGEPESDQYDEDDDEDDVLFGSSEEELSEEEYYSDDDLFSDDDGDVLDISFDLSDFLVE